MRPWQTLFALILMTALVLAGCLQVPDPTGDDAAGDEAGPDSEGDTSINPASNDVQSGPGKGSQNGDDAGDDGNGDDDNGTVPEGAACHEHSPPKAAIPAEHEVDSVDDLMCPGHYTITRQGSGKTWQVPEWYIGDWWIYEHEDMAGNCMQAEESVTDDSQTHLGVPVYTVETQRYDECGGSPDGDPSQQNRSKESLQQIQDNGRMLHSLLFPVKEDKKWFFAGTCSPNCTIIEVYDVSHIPEHNHGGLFGVSVEAWYVEWGFSGAAGDILFKQWWSVDHKALLVEEMHLVNPPPGIFNPINKKTLVESSYDEDGDKSPLPLPIGAPKI